jgi:hypothetical protein
MLIRSLCRNLSLFLSCYLYSFISLLCPLVPCNISHPFPSIHSISLFPFALSTLSLDFLFSSLFSSSQFLAPLSPILPLKSPHKRIRSSLFSFIASSTRLLIVFISLGTVYCHYFPPFIAYMNVLSIHPSSSPFSCIPNFTPVIIPPVALPFFFSLFAP